MSRFLFELESTFFRLNGRDMSNFLTYGEYRRAKNPDDRPHSKISGNRPPVTGKRQRIAPPRYFLIIYNLVLGPSGLNVGDMLTSVFN